ncbi:hypothetical protein C8Q70DRAFT_906899 [Cubamyces menziesii]|uniref:Uncharacterized protein n=1 Tax=Trametes cubensis TaxID=1111947 RepID=A0AAD7XEX4_9APHY|nr:hypothetical protein C8Q70DRAFT_906899 [Cubamyces menziesii]KAJ8487409.1 hypothetical protein ONZ51_g4201 [Trametes cubensis]
MQLTTGLPLLFALGARVFINTLLPDPTHTPSTPDYLLNGLFQGVLIQNTLTQLPQAVIVVACGVAVKLVIDFSRDSDVVQTACTVLGVALGVLVTDLLSQFIDPAILSTAATPERIPLPASPVYTRESLEPSKRIRLVSFGRDRTRSHRHREREEHDRHREREREREHERHGRPTDIRPITPTLTYCSTAPSISLDSVPSSLDPEGKLSPQEREVAVLRARASLADSERRRFKEERKWALSQGNMARASQLAWQVKRYTALMESFHREADAKVVEAARAAAAPNAQAAGPTGSASRRRSHSRPRKSSLSMPNGGNGIPPSSRPNDPPLVSVSIGANPRTRKRSGGTATLKPAIFVQGRE